MSVSVYNFTSFLDYLRVVSERHLARGRRPFTAQEWARRLGYRAAQSVTMVLTGQRLPSRDMVGKLARDLQLNDDEHRYFELLVELERRKRSGEPVTEVMETIKRVNPGYANRVPVDAATFSFLAEWYHLPIKQLIDAPEFREDLDWIRETLRNKVSTAEVASAIETLKTLGLVTRDPVTGSLRTTGKSLQSVQDVPVKTLRAHHKQMLARALEAMDEQAVDEREIQSLTLRVAPQQLPAAKAAIRRFKDEFDHQFEDLGSGSVYQLNIQFFCHTGS